MKKSVWTRQVWECRPRLRKGVALALIILSGFLAWVGTSVPETGAFVFVMVIIFFLISMPLECIKHVVEEKEEMEEERERNRKWDEEYEGKLRDQE